MHGRDGGILARAALLFVALAVLTAASGCGKSGGGSAAGPAKAVLDTGKALETAIVAVDGGTVGLVTDDGSLVRLTFPSDALAKDMTIVATPLKTAPGQDADTVDKGFDIEEKGTGKGPALKTPVWVEMVLPKELGDDVAMVSYADDGSYEVLPTRIVAGNGRSAILALATHFSKTGTRKVGKSKAKQARNKFADFNWVVYINNKQTGNTGGLQQSVTLKLRAVNTGGDIAGDYKGSATISSTNEGNVPKGYISAPMTGASQGVDITLTSSDALASLVDDDPLASLTTDGSRPDKAMDEMPKWFGSGTIVMGAMTAGGTVTGTSPKGSGSAGVSNTSSLPITMDVTGTQVKLTVTGLAPGAMTFSGYVIGEGKK